MIAFVILSVLNKWLLLSSTLIFIYLKSYQVAIHYKHGDDLLSAVRPWLHKRAKRRRVTGRDPVVGVLVI